MQHMIDLADYLNAKLGLPTIIEPSRADSPAHIRLLAGELNLKELGQGIEQTDIPYIVNLSVTASMRLLGGNEAYRLMHQAMAYAIRFAECLHEPFTVQTQKEKLSESLVLEGEASIHSAQRTQSGFHRLSESEDDTEGRLFLFREDWQMTLTSRVLLEHNPPTLQKVTYKPGHGGDPLVVTGDNGTN